MDTREELSAEREGTAIARLRTLVPQRQTLRGACHVRLSTESRDARKVRRERQAEQLRIAFRKPPVGLNDEFCPALRAYLNGTFTPVSDSSDTSSCESGEQTPA